MAIAAGSLRDRAASIFADLGYEVSAAGTPGELRAERKWRVVRVTPMAEPATLPPDGEMRCFVTPAEHAGTIERRLADRDPCYEWAVIGVHEDDYDVRRSR